MVTAARDSETVQSVFRYGAIDYIVKPFRFDRFKSALDNYKALRLKLAKNELNQEEIDYLASTKVKPQQRELQLSEELLPKGLNAVTMKQILLFFY
ncbi:hypothetical protein GCM10020331_083790 [Ectobacillus funiculus]